MRARRTRRPRLVALVGGSGAGKTFLAAILQRRLRGRALCLSLDDFYRDRSNVPVARRDRLNFDHPRAIDWAALARALRQLARRQPARIPQYDFATHTRKRSAKIVPPREIVLVDGLWLCHHRAVRELFDCRIFIACPAMLRWQRRLRRDVAERGRTAASVRRQYDATVAPMHRQFVAPQARWCHRIVRRRLDARGLAELRSWIES